MNSELLLAEATDAILVSWWKMLLIAVPLAAWAWLISSKLDKDARYFHLKHRRWNGMHLGAGAAGLVAMLAIPVFWIGWPVGVLIMAVPVLVYWQVRNKEVPQGQRFTLSGGGAGLGSRLQTAKKARAARAAVVQFIDSAKQERQPPAKDDPLNATHMIAEDLLGSATSSRVTRVEVALSSGGTAVAQTIDGVRYKLDPIPAEAGTVLLDYLKDIAGLNVEDRRRKQRGACQMIGPSGKAELSITTRGSSSGQVMQIDLDRAKRLLKPFDSLGLLPSQLEALGRLAQPQDRHGVVLIGAPAGHGLTTTAYSFLGRHDAYTCNVKTLEREAQTQLDGVDQTEWDPTNPDVDYATALQSILRRDPDVVLTDLIKDSETASITAEPGMKGPLVYIPQVLPGIGEQVRDWVKRVGDVKRAVRPLQAVTNQRLLRNLCPNCRQPFAPTAEQLKRLNLSSGKVKQLFRASGKVQIKNKIENCTVCSGSGYLGQTAAFEVMMVDDEGRKILASGDLKAALAHARRNKMIYLQEAALSKVVSGDTTIEEVIRVTAPAKSDVKANPAA